MLDNYLPFTLGPVTVAQPLHNKWTHLIGMPRGAPFDLLQIAAYLGPHDFNVVAMVQRETCSGMLDPLAEIGGMTKANYCAVEAPWITPNRSTTPCRSKRCGPSR